MTRKNRRRTARWLKRWARYYLRHGDVTCRYHDYLARMHNERRITLPPED